MKTRNLRPTMLLPCLVLAVLSLTGCPNTVNMGMGKYGKVVLTPVNGDTLKWPFDVTFQGEGASPCEGGAKTTKECKIKVQFAQGQTSARFRYNCDGCQDPELEVGPATGFTYQSQQVGAAGAKFPKFVVIPCSGGTIKPDPTPVAVKQGEVIEWENVGGAGVNVPNWTVSVATSGICTETSINQGAPFCNIATATAGDYTYTVHDTANVCSNGTGTIRVTP